MNPTFVLTLTLAVVGGFVCGDDEKYSDKYYDSIDVDEFLNNGRLYKKYLECLVADEDKKCIPEGEKLLKIIPDALSMTAKCTEKLKSAAEKVIMHMRKHNVEDWERFTKWDEEGVYVQKYAGKLLD